MSARELLQAGLCGMLTDQFSTGEVALPVFDAPPVRAPALHLVVEEPVLTDWSAKGFSGREGRLAVQLLDRAERPLRLRALTGLVEDAIEGMDAELGAGWRIVTLMLVRSRILRGRDGWLAVSEFRVRMMRVN